MSGERELNRRWADDRPGLYTAAVLVPLFVVSAALAVRSFVNLSHGNRWAIVAAGAVGVLASVVWQLRRRAEGTLHEVRRPAIRDASTRPGLWASIVVLGIVVTYWSQLASGIVMAAFAGFSAAFLPVGARNAQRRAREGEGKAEVRP